MTRGGRLDGVTTAHLQYFNAILPCVLSKLFMAALRSRCGHIFALWLLFFVFSSPNLSRRTLDVYHTSTHGVARLNANLECRSEMCWCSGAARGWLKIQDAKMAKNSPSGHHHTTLLGCVCN